MSVAAILGAGPLGAAIAQRLAERSRFAAVRLLDEAAAAASGKALDLLQSAPISGFTTALEGRGDLLAAAGASVVIVADAVEQGEWCGERALALLGRLLRAGVDGPYVFAGPRQIELVEKASRELKAHPDRLVATAPSALVGAARSLVGLELDRSPVDVQLTVTGTPPDVVVGWSAATVGGMLLTEQVPAHRLMAISHELSRLWPPGPQAIAAATAPIAEALAFGSRRLHQAVALLDGELGLRGAAMLPLAIVAGRIARRIVPPLSPQERVRVRGTGPFSTDRA
jgi:malate dehydrogenase